MQFPSENLHASSELQGWETSTFKDINFTRSLLLGGFVVTSLDHLMVLKYCKHLCPQRRKGLLSDGLLHRGRGKTASMVWYYVLPEK